jgi:probable FeS assembly SUF system protein SufT
MYENSEVILSRDTEAIQIPSGNIIQLPAGMQVIITQSLGGSYTVATPQGLARITGDNADSLGLERTAQVEATPATDGRVEEKAVWDVLKTCYDPEIPVNIVDLGLVYDCRVEEVPAGGASVEVRMTLTAPGCGMGPTLASEARSKILALPGVTDANVELVWDPPWNQSMISELGKMKLGMI